MTKPPSIKTSETDKFDNLDLHELESILSRLQQSPPTSESKQTARALRQTIRLRQRQIKAKVMEFELINDHHLLIFDSTDNFSKIAGRSVLFYSLTIASRLHRRFSIKNDTDDYSRSEDGIISIRALNQLEIQLAEINIYPDRNLTTSELHFYKLPRHYTEEQIAKLRDRSRKDIDRINSIILPKSPVPELYSLILEFNRLLYHNCKHISDGLARDTIIHELILKANEIIIGYLNFANAKPSKTAHRPSQNSSQGSTQNPPQILTQSSTTKPSINSSQAQHLFNILLNCRHIKNSLANVENLRLLHHRELRDLLEKLIEIERLTSREYNKQIRTSHENPQPEK